MYEFENLCKQKLGQHVGKYTLETELKQMEFNIKLVQINLA